MKTLALIESSTNFTGGYRVLSYLDPYEENHTKLKNFCFHVLKTNANKWFPEFERATGELCAKLDKQFAESGKAKFNNENMQMCFNFLCRMVLNRDPADPGPACLGTNGPSHFQKWIGLQLAPIASTGILPKILELVTIHAVRLPSLLVRGDYNKLYDLCWTYGKDALDTAEGQFGLKREEACHNLVFNICFNAFGGMFIFFPSLIKHIAAAGKQLHADLAEEVRAAIKDPKVFENPKEFLPRRFMGEEGEKLLKYVVWSNGPETEETAAHNKQCAGRTGW